MIKVFVSVGPEDPRVEFCFVPEGEIVYEGASVCPHACGCERSLAGTVTHKSTSLVKVAEAGLTDHDLTLLARAVGKDTGFGEKIIAERLRSTLAHAAEFEVGAVLQPEFRPDTTTWTYRPITENEEKTP